MDDDRIKDLFNSYNPDLGKDFAFMSRLMRNLDTIELLKRQNTALRRRNRLAVAIAAAVGFVSGFLFSLLIPYVAVLTGIHDFSSACFGILSLTIDYRTVIWAIIGCMSVLIALNAYEVAIAGLAPKKDILPN